MKRDLQGWITEDDGVFTVQIPEAHIRQQGIITAVVGPLAVGFLWIVLSALGYQEGWLVIVFWGVIFVPLLLLMLGLGLRNLLDASGRSARSRHVLDTGARTLDGVAIEVQGVQIRQPNRLLKFIAVEVVTPEGPRPFLENLTMHQGPAATELGERMAKGLGVPLSDLAGARSGDAFGMSDKTAAMLCWLPFQGIWLIASLYYLVRGKERPFVRSAAIQSLTLFGAMLLAYAVIGGGFGVLYALTDSDVMLIPLIGGVVVIAFGNLIVRAIGCIQSLRGKPWVVPGLRRITRRWLVG